MTENAYSDLLSKNPLSKLQIEKDGAKRRLSLFGAKIAVIKLLLSTFLNYTSPFITISPVGSGMSLFGSMVIITVVDCLRALPKGTFKKTLP